MDVPDFLRTTIVEGKAVLVLGAGASMEATDSRGNHPPSALALGSMLSDRFLGGKHKRAGLSEVAELAISESDLAAVQEHIRTIFEPFEPSDAHRLMTTFAWCGLATTNYDRLIEKAYELPDAIQLCRPRIASGDRVEEATRDPRALVLLKLHGCITRTTDIHCPLILTPDQYIEHRRGRERVFEQLVDWAWEHTLVFVGHGLQDPDLRALLLELTKGLGEARPRYHAVVPDFDEAQERFWGGRRISLLRGTFEEFMRSLDAERPRQLRKLPLATAGVGPSVAERFARAEWSLSSACRQLLELDVDYVKAAIATDVLAPSDFYRGYNPGWSAVEQDLDVRRALVDTILVDHFLGDESDRPDRFELLLVKGHAGAGKSVLLRRIAWDAARTYDCICLFVRPHGVINTAAVQELIDLCSDRIYLFVDDAADRVRELQHLARNIGPEGKRLTVIIAERINEWNMACSDLFDLVTSEYELRYLSSSEIDRLLALLDRHHALGTLASATPEERRDAFVKRAGRQLLVALHEATLGRPFEDIIEDEYANIQPDEAQRIYRTICMLNRLNVRVRAGIVSRIHGVPFEDFRARLFAPLEHVVRPRYDPVVRDYMYQARHPHIAQIVFERTLRNAEERYDAFVRCLQSLNIDYSDDRSAYRQMVRGRNLLDWFPDHSMVRSVYDIASSHIGEDAYLLHQMAIYEMNRPDANLSHAGALLDRAASLAPSDPSIRHSIAERFLKSADKARSALEREQFLRKAAQAATSLRAERPDDSPSYHTIIKAYLAKLKDVLAASDSSDVAITDATKQVETHLSGALQRFPHDPHIRQAEAEFATLTSDEPRVLIALREAFRANPRNAYIATRLAACYRAREDRDGARQVLEAALEANPGDRILHYAYARLLMQSDGTDGAIVKHHLRRAFTAGDHNYDAQILYGRQLFLGAEFQESALFFQEASRAARGPGLRDRIRHPLPDAYHGQITRREASYCFIEIDGSRYRVYAHQSDVDNAAWEQLNLGSRVVLRIGFTLRGARAFDLRVELPGT